MDLNGYQNNAGIALELKETTFSIRELMEMTYTTNVFGVAVLIEAALPLLEKSNFPRIINVSSVLGSLTKGADKDSLDYNTKFVVRTLFFDSLQVKLDTDPTQAYNSSKTALNSLTVHYAYVLEKKRPGSRVFAIDPGYNRTAATGYTGRQDPKIGAAGIVAAVTQGADSEWKTADFRDQFGKLVPW
jgi:NAD(P)-dependent dehydrogenase (short-subunit alcohol dehydrogenase family)